MERNWGPIAALAALAALALSCGRPPARPPAPAAATPALAADASHEASAEAGPPPGYVQVSVAGVSPNDDGSHVVVLADERGRRLLPLAIGGTEAASIALRHADERFPRPLTHDLFDSALRALGGRVIEVRIDALRDGVFHGSVVVRRGGQSHTLDARPSDAIALALGSDAPIYVAEPVLDAGGIHADDLPQEAPDTMPPPRELPPPAQPSGP